MSFGGSGDVHTTLVATEEAVDPNLDARAAFDLAPGEVHLNHGSFGAVPHQAAVRQVEIEAVQRRNFHRFYDQVLFGAIDAARLAVADWLGAEADGLVLTRNATTALATAVRCLGLRPGDEVLTTDLEYPSTYANLRRACLEAGAELVMADVAGLDDDEALDRLTARVRPSTAAVVVSQVTSPWSTLLPVERLHEALSGGRPVLVVDGAHVPGLMDVDVSRLGSAFFCTTLHKWACFPRGTGALYVPGSHRDVARPLVDALFADCPKMTDRFAWSGTDVSSGFLVADEVLAVHRFARERGWDEAASLVADHARRRIAEVLPTAVPVSDPRVRRMVTWRLPGIGEPALRTFLRERDVWTWVGTADDETHLRVSAAWYNTFDDVERLAELLEEFRLSQ